MIAFDLTCEEGHRFEGWFDSHKDLASQIRRGLVQCPVCGSEKVRQAPSSFAISRQGRNDAPDRDQQVASHLLGRALKRYLSEQFEDVGPNFAKEALKIHYGVTESRNIRGVSTPGEEQMLHEEGVSFFKVGTASQPSTAEDDED